MAYQISYAYVSHIGKVRGNNEDNFWCCGDYLNWENSGTGEIFTGEKNIQNYPVLAVFDGMGGESHGEMAAYTASCELGNCYKIKKNTLKNTPEQFAKEACTDMNQAVCKYEKENKIISMGTTVAMLAFGEKEFCSCNLGDSRIYKYQNEKLEQVSVDHVWGGRSFGKAPLTQCLGIEEDTMILEPDIQTFPYEGTLKFLLCSDGVTDMLSDQEIESLMHKKGSLKESVHLLMEKALEKGGKDNITIILCEITEKTTRNFIQQILEKIRKTKGNSI